MKYITIEFFYIIKYVTILLLLVIFLWEKYTKKKKPKVSIFLPIYNKENYLKKCIQSLQKQTLKDIEIIAVNDCSNDTSLQILSDMANYDKRIKIVNNDRNHGLLYSRAMGILNSSGEYLLNLDADDELEGDDSLEYLYNLTLISNADIITFDIFNKKLNLTFKCHYENQIQTQPMIFESIFANDSVIKDYLIWNKLIKKEIFLKAYEVFKEQIYNWKWNYFEDDIWNILVNRFAKTKLCINKLVYIYNNNNDSLMNNRYGKDNFQNLLYRHEMYKKLFSTKEDEKYLIAEYYYLLNRFHSEMKYLLLINDYKIKENIIKVFQHFLNNYNCSKNQTTNINNLIKSIN